MEIEVGVGCRAGHTHTGIAIEVGCVGGAVSGVGIGSPPGVVLLDVLVEGVRVDEVGRVWRCHEARSLALAGVLVVVVVGGARWLLLALLCGLI